jgi:hypothetical protein
LISEEEIMTVIITAIAVVIGFFVSLAVQVGEARAEEARASWLTSPQGQAWARKAQAEKFWKDTFYEVLRQTGGDFVAACLAAEEAAKPCFAAAYVSAEEARKTSQAILNKDCR